MAENKELQVKEKSKAAVPAEQTKPGLVFNPAVDIFETHESLTLLADMPGVKAEGLNIDLRDNVLIVEGEVAPFEKPGEKEILTEFEVGKYWRRFALSEVIDQSKIVAMLKDGVLRLTLPKIEKAKPRKIAVQVG